MTAVIPPANQPCPRRAAMTESFPLGARHLIKNFFAKIKQFPRDRHPDTRSEAICACSLSVCVISKNNRAWL